MEHRDDSRLSMMARGNEHRTKVLAGRKERSKSTSRHLECRQCLNRTFSFRDKDDICSECVCELWTAQDVAKASEKTGVGDEMVALRFSTRSHDFPYPPVGTFNIPVPSEAIFNIDEREARRTLQNLFHKLMMGLAQAYPVEPQRRANAETFFGVCYDRDTFAYVPKQSRDALVQLWSFVNWIAAECQEEGYRQGQSLLAQLALGEKTVEQMNEMIAIQTAAMHRKRDAAIKGEKGNR